MNLKHIEHICLAIAFGFITSLMTYAATNQKIVQFLFNNPDKTMNQGFSAFLFMVLLGVFGVHFIFNIMNAVWYDRKLPKTEGVKHE